MGSYLEAIINCLKTNSLTYKVDVEKDHKVELFGSIKMSFPSNIPKTTICGGVQYALFSELNNRVVAINFCFSSPFASASLSGIQKMVS